MGTYTDSVMLRLEPAVKQDLTRRARRQGLDLSTALRMEAYRMYNDPSFEFASNRYTYAPVTSEDEAMELTRVLSRKALNETR